MVCDVPFHTHYVDALPVYVRKSSLSGQKFVRNSINNHLEKAQAHDKGKTFVSMILYYVEICKNARIDHWSKVVTHRNARCMSWGR